MEIDNIMYKQILLFAVLIVGFLLVWFIPSIIKKFKNCLKTNIKNNE